jgi:hypothetical protein
LTPRLAVRRTDGHRRHVMRPLRSRFPRCCVLHVGDTWPVDGVVEAVAVVDGLATLPGAVMEDPHASRAHGRAHADSAES